MELERSGMTAPHGETSRESSERGDEAELLKMKRERKGHGDVCNICRSIRDGSKFLRGFGNQRRGD